MPVTEFGRIGRDAELRYTASGDAVCGIPIAVEYGRKGQDGKKPTQWYDVTLWGKQAEALSPYLLKGKQVFFVGSDLHVEAYQKGDGSQGIKLSCRCAEIKFASDSASQGQSTGTRNASAPAPSPKPAPRPAEQPDAFDDDIPF